MTYGTLVRCAPTVRRGVRRDFDRLVDDLIGGFGLAPLAFPAQPVFQPTFQATELENEYRITADLPGVEPADLEVTVEDGVLAIRGQRHFERDGGEQENPKAESEPGVVTRIDGRGRFERRFRLPGEIAEQDVRASYKHGVLTVNVPKLAPTKVEVRTIPVETA